MIASAQTLRALKPVEPFEDRKVFEGMSYGLSSAGYDIRIHEDRVIYPGKYDLAASLECFRMPDHLLGIVHDKSTWARRGLAVQNTVIEPGWKGFLTLELTNHGGEILRIKAGSPIAQIVFHLLDHPTEKPYTGKYQNQEAGPQIARYE